MRKVNAISQLIENMARFVAYAQLGTPLPQTAADMAIDIAEDFRKLFDTMTNLSTPSEKEILRMCAPIVMESIAGDEEPRALARCIAEKAEIYQYILNVIDPIEGEFSHEYSAMT